MRYLSTLSGTFCISSKRKTKFHPLIYRICLQFQCQYKDIQMLYIIIGWLLKCWSLLGFFVFWVSFFFFCFFFCFFFLFFFFFGGGGGSACMANKTVKCVIEVEPTVSAPLITFVNIVLVLMIFQTWQIKKRLFVRTPNKLYVLPTCPYHSSLITLIWSPQVAVMSVNGAITWKKHQPSYTLPHYQMTVSTSSGWSSSGPWQQQWIGIASLSLWLIIWRNGQRQQLSLQSTHMLLLSSWWESFAIQFHKTLITVPGRELCNQVNDVLFERLEIEHRVCMAPHPQRNGQTVRRL